MKKQISNENRRDFLKKGFMGIAGATFLPNILKGQSNPKKDMGLNKDKFIYRTLGKTGIKLPIISMGVMNANNPHLVKAALDAGIVHLDTAWYYQNGRNEEMIGEVIKGLPRDSYVIATKIYEFRDRKTGLFPRDASSKSFIDKFETSLKRLGLNYVDILYLHNISRKESITFGPYLSAMKKFQQEGKVKFLGVSTHRNEPEIITTTTDSKEYDVILTSYNFRQHHHEEIRKAAEYAANAGMGIIGMKAIAGSVYNIGKKVNVNAKAALKWSLQPECFHTNIAGFTTFDQMYTDLSIMENLKIDSDEKAQLNENKAQSGLFCQQCEKCIPQCRKELDIPTLMRSYMYAYGYKNMTAAKETMDTINIKDNICVDCNICSVHCSMNFNVKEKIQKITRIKNIPDDFLV